MSDDEDRKFDPTPARREKFRKEGRFARSREAGPAVAAVAAIGALAGTYDAAARASEHLIRVSMGASGSLGREAWDDAGHAAARALGLLVAPPLVAAAIGGFAVGAAQSGLRVETSLLAFKAERLDPIAKLKQMASPSHAAAELGLALLKVVLIGYVAYEATRAELPILLGLLTHDLGAASGSLLGAMARVAVKVLAATAVVAAVEYARSRYDIGKQLKMTIKELKDEMKQEDGDPHVKAKIRARARAASRQRMMTDVKGAAVVVTNPTHVAVALRYGPKDPVPFVVAKGHDEVALAIRREARSHGVPIVENRRLARALDADVPIGKPVRVEHFAAVARVLAFVFKMAPKARARAA